MDDKPMSAWRALSLTPRMARRDRGFWYGLACDLLWPFLVLSARLRFRGNLPPTGGVVLVSNHLSFADPVSLTAFVLTLGRVPRYLAKASLWRVPLIGRVLAGGKHVPVERGTAQARHAFHNAVKSVADGECVVFFPEAGFSDNTDHWPSTKLKNGAARVALETGAPVIPVANWGSHELLPPKARFPKLLPRKTIHIITGDPVDLSDITTTDRAALDEATTRIMRAVTTLLADIRGEQPPTTP